MRLADLVVLYAAFGLSSEMASKARKRGYFCPNGGKIVEPCVDAAAFAAIEESVLEECRQGARRALRKFFGDSWHTKLRAYTFDDVAAAAVEHLRNRSGRPEFSAVRWRVVCAYFGALNFISKQAKRAVRETTTVDELEGRFGEQ